MHLFLSALYKSNWDHLYRNKLGETVFTDLFNGILKGGDFHRVSGRIFAEPILQIPAEANRDFIFCKTKKFKGQVAVWSRFENTFRYC